MYYIIEDQNQKRDANGCLPSDYMDGAAISHVTPRGRRLLAQDVHPMRVVALGEAILQEEEAD